MSDAVLLEIIKALAPIVLSTITAIVTVITLFHTARVRAAVTEVVKTNTVIAADVLKVEKATNSMKDALVAAEKKVSLEKGRLEGKAEEKAIQVRREGEHPV